MASLMNRRGKIKVKEETPAPAAVAPAVNTVLPPELQKRSDQLREVGMEAPSVCLGFGMEAPSCLTCSASLIRMPHAAPIKEWENQALHLYTPTC